MKKKKYLFTSSLLALSLLLTSFTAYAEDNTETSNEAGITEEDIAQADRELMKDLLPGDLSLVELSDKELDDYEIPEVISKKDIIQNRNVNRLFAQETDDHSIVFQNKDGSKTMYCFNEPVKYIDENGTVCDKSTKLSETDKDGYAFVSADNDINVYMPEQLDSETGIIVKSGEYTIEMSPIDATEADVSEIITKTANKYDEHDIVEYNGAFGADTAIEYSAQLNGVKENIILDRYSGKSEFSFDVDTNGLALRDEDGYFSIIDEEKNEAVGTVSEVILFDSSNGENTIVPQGYVTGYTAVRNDDGNYTITIKLDEKWLAEEAVYPVTIDPTITINSTGSGSSKSIIDTPIYNGSGATGTAGANSLAVIGYVDSSYGSGRHLMRFPSLMKQSFMSNQNYIISSATLHLKEVSGNSPSATISAHIYTGPTWSESSKYSYSIWNGSYKKNGVEQTLSTYTYSYPNNTTGSFNITQAVRLWQSNHSYGNKGIILKNRTSESNGTYSKALYTSEGATKPYVSVTYTTRSNASNAFLNYGSTTRNISLQLKGSTTTNSTWLPIINASRNAWNNSNANTNITTTTTGTSKYTLTVAAFPTETWYGLTTTSSSNGVATSAKIEINTSTIGSSTAFRRSTVTHEFAHLMWLDDNPSTTDFSLMRHDRDREMIYTPQMIDIYHLLKKY